MKKLIVFLLPLLIVGCSESAKKEALSSPASSTPVFAPGAPTQASTISVPATPARKIGSPLEAAQKDYLAAYDEYVRLLRESGPQTMDTLQALAEYQKKYQIYQMLLRAEK